MANFKKDARILIDQFDRASRELPPRQALIVKEGIALRAVDLLRSILTDETTEGDNNVVIGSGCRDNGS